MVGSIGKEEPVAAATEMNCFHLRKGAWPPGDMHPNLGVNLKPF